MISILQMNSWRRREVTWLGKGHPAQKKPVSPRDSNPDPLREYTSLHFKPHGITPALDAQCGLLVPCIFVQSPYFQYWIV
jgi:hypothetical protein